MMMILVATAWARSCTMDLQVVFLNAADAAKRAAPVAAVDRISGGLFSAAFGGALDAAVFELTRKAVADALREAALTGTVKVVDASQSGRSTGWTYWSPATGVRQPAALAADALADRRMLVVHLDDPRDAAIRVGGQAPVVVDIARFFGVDIAEKVYSTIVYEKMQAPMAESGLEAWVNTGKGVRCPASKP